MGLVANKLLLAFKNKKGFLEYLVMNSKASILSVLNNIKKWMKENTSEIPADLQANAEKTVESSGNINGALKSVIEGLINFEHQVEEIAEAFGKGVMEKAIPFLDKAGEITLANGQSINLLPTLGTSTAEVLEEAYQSTKDLAKAGMEATAPIINNIVNQMTPTSPVSMPMVAATAIAAGAGVTAISRYRFGKGKIR
jgi:hypothetical protein